jgi:hypothetical protein
MARVRMPRLRWWGWLGVVAGLLLAYLVALSAVPAIFGTDPPRADREAAHRAITAPNWSLVVPNDREQLARAVDESWRALRAYRLLYRAGTPADLGADRPLITSDTILNLGKDGRIAAQRDTNITAAAAPGAGGREVRFEGYRILTDRPYVNSKGHRVADAELVYQQTPGGVWTCQRGPADKQPIAPPGLRLSEAGDAGFAEIDGQRVRGFTVPVGAFGLRQPATVWVDVERLLVRRQEIDSVIPGQREIWTYSAFDDVNTITPPPGVTCIDD